MSTETTPPTKLILPLTLVTTPKGAIHIEDNNPDPETDTAIGEYLLEILAQKTAARIRQHCQNCSIIPPKGGSNNGL